MKHLKKIIGFIIVLLVMFLLYKVSLYVSKEFFAKDTIPEREVPKVVVDKEAEDRISNVTQIILEKYDSDNNVLREEIINTPIEYIGFTRDELVSNMRQYVANPSSVDKTAGMTAFELVSFSKHEVIIRKSYSIKNLPSVYYIFVENGYLNIYLEDKKTLYDYTDIKLESLPENIRQEIMAGKRVESQKALYEFLQTYTS